MASSIENLLHTLEQDRKLLARFRQLLNLEDDYAKKSDLYPILEELKAQRKEFSSKFDNVYDELKAQREEFSSKFDNVYDELKAQREEMKIQREEYNEKFDMAIEEIRAMRGDVNQINQRMDKSEGYLKAIGGTNLELHSRDYFRAILDAKGIFVKREDLKWNVHLKDTKQRLGTEDIQLDLFCKDPLIAVEITNYVDSLDKISKFIQKLEFLIEKYDNDPIAVIITYEVNQKIRKSVNDLLSSNNIKLVTLGRNDFFE